MGCVAGAAELDSKQEVEGAWSFTVVEASDKRRADIA